MAKDKTIAGEAEKIAESLEQATARLEIEKKLLEIRKALSNESKTALDYEFEHQKLGVDQLRIKQDAAEDLARTHQTEIEILKLKLTQTDLEEGKKATLEANLKTEQRAVDATLASAAALRDGADEAERRAKALGTTINHADNLFKRITPFLSEEPETAFASFILEPGKFTKKFSENIAKFATPMGLMTGLLDIAAMETAKLAIEQDAAVVNFRRATGATGEFDDNIRGLERSLFTAGVGAAEAGQAVQTLFLNVTDFTEMSEKQQETLGETVAVLNELGVASETTAKNIQFATKVMGKSTDQAAALQRELFTFAQELGVSGDKMASDFAAMGPQIAALGTKGVDAFRQLEVQAKNTGLALTEILGIVEKFDKFDSAADSVSRLNALLGGPYLNALELVAETDPSKRFEILKDRIDDAGLSFDSMDYYQRKAIASAMGLNEQQLALMMRGKLDLIREPQKSAADIEALAKQTKDFNSIMEELSQLAKGLAISFGPLIGWFKGFLQLLSPIIENLDVIIIGLVAYGIAMKGAALATAIQTSAVNALTMATKRNLLLGGLAIFLPYLASAGKSFKVLAMGLGIVTAAVWALGVAEKSTVILGVVGLVVTGIAALVHSLTVGNSPSLVEAFMMVAAAIPLMGLALAGLLPMLPALLLLIPPLALGFATISESLAGFFSDTALTSLQLIAVEIANIVDKINELSTEKAIKLAASTSVTAESAALIKNLDTATLDKISTVTTANTVATTNINQTNAAAAAGTGMPTGFEGPPPTINVNLSIDGKEFATTVNSVDVSKYIGGKSSNLYNSIVDMIGQGINTGKGAP